MSKLLLKALPTEAASSELAISAVKSIGYIDTAGNTQRLIVKAKPKTTYVLVDAQTGEVIKQQHVLRFGRSIQIQVDSIIALELDEFFSSDYAVILDSSDSAHYLVDTGADSVPTYGLVNAQTPITVSENGLLVLWTPGMNSMPLIEPVAYGPQLASIVTGIGGSGSAVLIATSAGVIAGKKDATPNTGASNTSSAASATGGVHMGPVSGKADGSTGLKVQAFDKNGKNLGETEVAADGSYTLTLKDAAYTGLLVIKVFTSAGAGAKYQDEATGVEKDFTTSLLAVVNYTGTHSSLTVNVTPLTHIAALKAGLGVTDTGVSMPSTVPSTEDISRANIEVAQWFKLPVSDLCAAPVTTSEKATVNDYGRALALLSQFETTHGKTTAEVADIIKKAVSGDTTEYVKLKLALDADDTVSIPNVSKTELKAVATIDTTRPALVSANTGMDGQKIYLHFDALLSLNTASAKNFTVNVTASGSTELATVSHVAIEGDDLVLTLASAVKADQTMSVNYTDPSSDNDAQAVQDLSGNDAGSFTQSVSNQAGLAVPALSVQSGQSFSYAENRSSSDTLGKVALLAGDADVKKFRFADSLSALSKDGFFQIDKAGNISLTIAGLNRRNASNDFETTPNSFSLQVQAGDNAGNWSTAVSVSLNVTDARFNDSLDAVSGIAGGASTANGFKGVAITANHATATQGTWQYLLSAAGSAWTDLPLSGLSETSAVYLASDSKLRFVASAHFNGSPDALTVHLIDDSYSQQASFATAVDFQFGTATSSGSAATVSLGTSITPVNDKPVASGNASLSAIDEDTTEPEGQLVSGLFAGNFNDSNDAVSGGSAANSLAGVAVVANTANPDTQGKWQWQAADAAVWTDVSTTVTDAAAQYVRADSLLRFVPVGDFNGTPPALKVRLVDDGPGESIRNLSSGAIQRSSDLVGRCTQSRVHQRQWNNPCLRVRKAFQQFAYQHGGNHTKYYRLDTDGQRFGERFARKHHGGWNRDWLRRCQQRYDEWQQHELCRQSGGWCGNDCVEQITRHRQLIGRNSGQ